MVLKREIKCNKRKTIVVEVTVKWGVYTKLCLASVLVSVHLTLETVARIHFRLLQQISPKVPKKISRVFLSVFHLHDADASSNYH